MSDGELDPLIEMGCIVTIGRAEAPIEAFEPISTPMV
jgi:hypothetical protein